MIFVENRSQKCSRHWMEDLEFRKKSENKNVIDSYVFTFQKTKNYWNPFTELGDRCCQNFSLSRGGGGLPSQTVVRDYQLRLSTHMSLSNLRWLGYSYKMFNIFFHRKLRYLDCLDLIETSFFVSSLKSRCGFKKSHRKILKKKIGRKIFSKMVAKIFRKKNQNFLKSFLMKFFWIKKFS